MTTVRVPVGLATRGKRLWTELTEKTLMNAAELVILEEACRTADRLDKLDELLRQDHEQWVDLRDLKGRDDVMEIVMNSALSEARQQANVLKQLIAALRLPDELSGAKPQQRGGARGAYTPTGKAGAGAKVTSLDRARAARGG